ncbi:hypothetical protein DFH11DRAFT_1613139 [Phellopilus nigrolimitatus]|nr:hypothetical protein DFH11DRAFT_1613139 [Phellopilus nigrolimitatus]
MDYILLIRVLALFDNKKNIATCLRILFGVEAVFMLGLHLYYTVFEQIAVGVGLGFAFCGTENLEYPPIVKTLYWTAPLLFELVMMTLALYKAAQLWKATAGIEGMSLVKVLIQDQVIYFVMIMMCSIAKVCNYWTLVQSTPVTVILTLLGTTTLLCIIGSQMMVHLKEAGERGVKGGTSYRMETVTSITFA